ncbi:hypothetical protein NDU88_000890 [Pleurodeles waltl]|uniref:Uncharacterized protein n=1 Tax=Pleurodeles waltl TaxID=8319 RepID=A0AAV7MIU7_PLEWA|nr:hypothetical protein NDU88_000890 [Pleurodeles waltl]
MCIYGSRRIHAFSHISWALDVPCAALHNPIASPNIVCTQRQALADFPCEQKNKQKCTKSEHRFYRSEEVFAVILGTRVAHLGPQG